MGSGPGALQNEAGFVDAHDIVVRVNNYKTSAHTGYRTDVYYSFFGRSIKKSRGSLIADGVRLCMCKLPDAKIMRSRWHAKKMKMIGVDYRYIYNQRADYWFCPTYIPTLEEYMPKFELLGKHSPTTGFAAILDILSFEPASVYLTGFDFFQSGLHNVDEKWNPGDQSDPICHVPEQEALWLKNNMNRYPITVDNRLAYAIRI